MAALSAATQRLSKNRGAVHREYYTAGTAAVIYQGALVAFNTSTGRAVAASATTSRKILGVAVQSASSGATCLVEWNANYKFACAATKAYTGSNVAVSTDNDVTSMSAAGTSGVRVRVGELIKYVSSSEGWIAVRKFAVSDV